MPYHVEKRFNQLIHNIPWFLSLGVALIIIGSSAVFFSSLISSINIIYFGFFLIVLGFFEGVHAYRITQWQTFFLHLFMSLLYAAAGILIALDPIHDEALVTLLHAFFFISCGILRIIFSYEKEVVHPIALLLNGIITLLIGFLVALEWPESSLWVLGTLVGIDSIMTGWTWIMLSYQGKKIKETHAFF